MVDGEGEVRQFTGKTRTKRAQHDEGIVRDYREYHFYNRSAWVGHLEAQLWPGYK